MKIFLSPSEVTDPKELIYYEFDGDKIIARSAGIVEEYDFTGVPDGSLKLKDENNNFLIQSAIKPFPIMSIVKEEGVLYARLSNLILPGATEKEKFPEWIEHTEYEPPTIPSPEEQPVEDTSKIEGE